MVNKQLYRIVVSIFSESVSPINGKSKVCTLTKPLHNLCKSFNTINIRIDVLASIILDRFFPFYLYAPPRQRRWTRKYHEITEWAFAAWQDGRVEPYGSKGHYRVHYQRCVSIPSWFRRRQNVSATFYSKQGLFHKNVDFISSSCSCREYKMRGKYCRHLWAARIYARHGPLREFQQKCDENYLPGKRGHNILLLMFEPVTEKVWRRE